MCIENIVADFVVILVVFVVTKRDKSDSFAFRTLNRGMGCSTDRAGINLAAVK